MVAALPEKTLEHWASQYILYRFRSLAEMWWPAQGEDIRIADVPAKVGKLICLEVKTAYVDGRRQVIHVDLSQLAKYRAKPLYDQPFYVFPLPPWAGRLHSGGAATKAGDWVIGSERAFSRAGRPNWFADWTFVLTAAEVDSALGTALADFRAGNRGTDASLVTFDTDTASVSWPSVPTGPKPKLRGWLSFWELFDRCGEPGWPQRLLVSGHALKPGARTLTQAEGVQALRSGPHDHEARPSLVLLPLEGGGFEVVEYEAALGEVAQQADAVEDARRVAVFVRM